MKHFITLIDFFQEKTAAAAAEEERANEKRDSQYSSIHFLCFVTMIKRRSQENEKEQLKQ